jgi:hypothetical protein
MSFKFLGITDEITSCDCCGKTNLKKTVVLENESGNVVYYGVDCASQAITGNKKNRKLIETYAMAVQYAEKWYATCKERNTLENLANAIRVKYTNCDVCQNKIKIYTGNGSYTIVGE